MMKRATALLLTAALTIGSLTACAGSSAKDSGSTGNSTAADDTADVSGGETLPDDTTVSAAEKKESEPDYGSGTPWPDTDLEGIVTADMSADLKDNFALHVNKDKILNMEIPEGYSYGGTFRDVLLRQSEDLKNMFLGEAPDSHDARLAYNLFWLMMDWDGRNELGAAPLKEMTDAIEKITAVEDLASYFTDTPIEKQIDRLFTADSGQDLADSSRYILTVSDEKLLLGDSAEYRKLTPYGDKKKKAYTALAEKMLGKLGYSREEAAQKIENSFAFETMLSDVVLTGEEQKKPDYFERINNLYSREDLKAAQGKLPVLEFIEKTEGYPAAEEYIVTNPEYMDKLNELCTNENLPLIKDMLIVRGAIAKAGSLDRECYEWREACDNEISGATGSLDDETVFSAAVSDMIGWPVAQLYTQNYLKQEDKERITALVDKAIDAYHGILEEADFLSDETRAKAVEKLEAIGKHILYPDSWEKYSCEKLDIKSREEGGTLWDASAAIARFNLSQKAADYSKPVDKEKWGQVPQTVNCFYDPQSNSVYILGAFAQGGMYNSDMSDEELYGAVGALIGHEISHAFDSIGAQFDKNGDKVNWWTKEDSATFKERNEKLAAYYDAMHPWEGQDFTGSILTGEACADMAGIKVMLRIAAENPDFDYDTFFRSYANTMLMKDTLERAYERLGDTHPMGYLRINATLQQFDEFLDFYGIAEGDGMYLAPEKRVAIW